MGAKAETRTCSFQIVSEYSTLSPTKNYQFGPHQELQFLVGPKAEDKLVSFQTLTQSIPVWTRAKILIFSGAQSWR